MAKEEFLISENPQWKLMICHIVDVWVNGLVADH